MKLDHDISVRVLVFPNPADGGWAGICMEVDVGVRDGDTIEGVVLSVLYAVHDAVTAALLAGRRWKAANTAMWKQWECAPVVVPQEDGWQHPLDGFCAIARDVRLAT